MLQKQCKYAQNCIAEMSRTKTICYSQPSQNCSSFKTGQLKRAALPSTINTFAHIAMLHTKCSWTQITILTLLRVPCRIKSTLKINLHRVISLLLIFLKTTLVYAMLHLSNPSPLKQIIVLLPALRKIQSYVSVLADSLQRPPSDQ